ncbi:nucleotide exchange factor GrpE [Patescibacteria group bacterium]|nr:nucleotide exchange factor GrpE [Patescibacteria group bacterium]
MTKRNIKNEQEEEFKKKIEELETQLKRSLADYQNLEKRFVEEKTKLVKTANRQLLLRLLPALDALLLAEEHTKDQGVVLSIKHFLDILEKEGVKKIETKGHDFDPSLMECVQTIEGEEGKAIREVKSGYMLNDTVLRVAQVAVGKSKGE